MVIKIILIIALVNYILALITKKQSVAICGLIGFSGKTEYNLDKLRFLMLWNSIERGRDATGIFTPSTGTIKDAEPAAKFFSSKLMQENLKPDTTLIAHVRAKTVGANLAKNAHPFVSDKTVLAHNGTLTNYGTYANGLGAKYDIKYADYDVDSQILAIAVNKNIVASEGKELNIEVLSQYEGAAALLFYNYDTQCLYAYHDTNRPLWRGWDKDGNMYISSIALALDSADVYAIEEFEINTLYTIKDGGIIATKKYPTYEELHPKPVVVNVKSKKALRREKKKLPKLTKNQRGFAVGDSKSAFLVGYNLRAKVDCNVNSIQKNLEFSDKLAKINKDCYYQVTGYFGEDNGWLEIIDADGQEAQATMNMFDTTDFIPRKGDYIQFTKIIKRDKDKELLWKVGDLAIVFDESYEEGEIQCFHEGMNRLFTIPAHFFRYVSDEELEFIKSDVKLLGPSCEKDCSTDLIPFKDTEVIEPDMAGDEVTDEDTPNDDIPDEYIAIEIYSGMVKRLDDQIDSLETEYNSNMDITPQINEIKATLNLAMDPVYLEGLNA